MGEVIDLDAIRGEVEPRHIKLGGREWELPPELPAVFLQHLNNGDVTAAAEVLVGEEWVELAPLLDATVLGMIVRQVYGLLPEDGASSVSSKSTSKPSRPTSKRTTD
jgi:hypothetical protein